MFNQLNIMAILAATIAATVISAICFLPPVFGLRWAGLVKRWTGQSDADLSSGMLRRLLLWICTYLVNALCLAALLQAAGPGTLGAGLALAAVAWAGLGLAFSSWPVIHANQPTGIWLMNNTAYLLAQLAMAAILTLWR